MEVKLGLPRQVEKCRRVCMRTVLTGIFVTKREEATESWRKMHNEKLYSLYLLVKTVGMIR
jgi:hypothetical protein